MASGSAYTTTQPLEDRSRPEGLGYDPMAMAGGSGGGGGGGGRRNGPLAERRRRKQQEQERSAGGGGGGGPGSGSSSGATLVKSREEVRRPTVEELAVVEAPRVRELNLYESHSEAFMERFGKQAALGGNDTERPWEAAAVGRKIESPKREHYRPPRKWPELTPHSAGAAEKAELANACALEAYREKCFLRSCDAACTCRGSARGGSRRRLAAAAHGGRHCASTGTRRRARHTGSTLPRWPTLATAPRLR